MVTESSSGNVFWWESEGLHTPCLSAGALPGVTRGAIIDAARDLGWNVTETAAPASRLADSCGVFLTFSTRGLVPASTLDFRSLPTSERQSALQEAFLGRCGREWETV